MINAVYVQPVRILITGRFMFVLPLCAVENPLKPCAGTWVRFEISVRGLAQDALNLPRNFEERHQVPSVVLMVRVMHDVVWVRLVVRDTDLSRYSST